MAEYLWRYHSICKIINAVRNSFFVYSLTHKVVSSVFPFFLLHRIGTDYLRLLNWVTCMLPVHKLQFSEAIKHVTRFILDFLLFRFLCKVSIAKDFTFENDDVDQRSPSPHEEGVYGVWKIDYQLKIAKKRKTLVYGIASMWKWLFIFITRYFSWYLLFLYSFNRQLFNFCRYGLDIYDCLQTKNWKLVSFLWLPKETLCIFVLVWWRKKNGLITGNKRESHDHRIFRPEKQFFFSL